MSAADAALGVLIGLGSGVLSGLFGVGGGIVMTPSIQVLLGAPPIVALATPLPVIFPTALMGAVTYGRAGELDTRAAAWIVGPGIAGAVLGSLLTRVIDVHLLLVATSVLLAFESIRILSGVGSHAAPRTARATTPVVFAGIGLTAGLVSGLLGIGGGLVMVPLLGGALAMPLKRALGTSLLAIVVLVVPGTIVHTALGHVDWMIFLVVTLGAVPGARIGARLGLETGERTLRILVGSFLLLVALSYGTSEAVSLLRG